MLLRRRRIQTQAPKINFSSHPPYWQDWREHAITYVKQVWPILVGGFFLLTSTFYFNNPAKSAGSFPASPPPNPSNSSVVLKVPQSAINWNWMGTCGLLAAVYVAGISVIGITNDTRKTRQQDPALRAAIKAFCKMM